jgi:hypothetical protein
MSCAQNMRDALFIAVYAARAVQSELYGIFVFYIVTIRFEA